MFGFLGAAVSVASKLITGGDSSKVIEKGINAVDKLHFSDQEKAEMQAGFISKQVDENSIRSRARRVLAFMFCGNFILDLKIAVFCIFYYDTLEEFNKMLKVLELQGYAVTAIIIFYFGYYALSNIFKSKKDKK